MDEATTKQMTKDQQINLWHLQGNTDPFSICFVRLENTKQSIQQIKLWQALIGRLGKTDSFSIRFVRLENTKQSIQTEIIYLQVNLFV